MTVDEESELRHRAMDEGGAAAAAAFTIAADLLMPPLKPNCIIAAVRPQDLRDTSPICRLHASDPLIF